MEFVQRGQTHVDVLIDLGYGALYRVLNALMSVTVN
jgi:hypothetical protein